MTRLREFWRDTSAATSIEYAIIGAFLSILIVGGATAIGTKLKAKIEPVASGLS